MISFFNTTILKQKSFNVFLANFVETYSEVGWDKYLALLPIIRSAKYWMVVSWISATKEPNIARYLAEYIQDHILFTSNPIWLLSDTFMKPFSFLIPQNVQLFRYYHYYIYIGFIFVSSFIRTVVMYAFNACGVNYTTLCCCILNMLVHLSKIKTHT